MFKVNGRVISFIALALEGFFCGLYSGIFFLYLQCHASNKDADKKKNIVFYSMCTLYPLCVVVFVTDTIMVPLQSTIDVSHQSMVATLYLSLSQMVAFACCDVIAQFILIYRCWIVWGCNIRVVIIPSILAFAFLAIWLTGNSTMYLSSDMIVAAPWANSLLVSSLVLSLIVNALVTGLIVFRIFKVFRKAEAITNVQVLGPTGGRKLQHAVLVLIESGMALFSVQLVRLVVTIMNGDVALEVFFIVTAFHNMLNGIIPTLILLRTVMGLSFHDENSMEEFAIGSLNIVLDSDQETRRIQENRDDDFDIQRINNIHVIE